MKEEYLCRTAVIYVYPAAWVQRIDREVRIQPKPGHRRATDALGLGWTESEAWSSAATDLALSRKNLDT
jgi:hypothetical protein